MIAATLFFLGVALNALYSGAETGFYRLAKLRLLIDALSGDRVARGLMWAANNPAAFVATVMVGNNVSNYLSSLGLVMACDAWFPGSQLAGVMIPVALTPVLFIYTDLLPKNVFYAAPNRLLRSSAPALAASAVLFAPVSLALWGVGLVIQRLARTPTDVIGAVIARRELVQALNEGHAVGLLEGVQQRLTQAIFAVANHPVREFLTPSAGLTPATTAMNAREVLRLARRQRQPFLPVEETAARRHVVGYVRAYDCLMAPPGDTPPLRPLIEFPEQHSFLSALTEMQRLGEPLAVVRNPGAPRPLGYLRLEELLAALTTEAPRRGRQRSTESATSPPIAAT